MSAASDLSDWLREREVMQNLVRQHLIRAQDRMKRQADKGRSERVFQVGDRVYLKLQPYVKSSFFFEGHRGGENPHLNFIHRPLEGKTVHDLQQEIQLDRTQQRRGEIRKCNSDDKT